MSDNATEQASEKERPKTNQRMIQELELQLHEQYAACYGRADIHTIEF